MQNISVSKISLIATLVLHLMLVAVFYFSWTRKNETPPPVVVLEISMLGDKSASKKHESKSHYLKPDNQNNVQHYHSEKETDVSNESEKMAPVFNPLPQIPDDLREEAFVSEAIARFYIDAAGVVARVELIKPCANPRLNSLLLKSLRSWKFAASKAGSTQDIRVRFRVE